MIGAIEINNQKQQEQKEKYTQKTRRIAIRITVISMVVEESSISCTSTTPRRMGQPLSNRFETKQVMQSLFEGSTTHDEHYPKFNAYYGQGPLILSDIPQSILQQSSFYSSSSTEHKTKNHNKNDDNDDKDNYRYPEQEHSQQQRGVIVGIDEAGRGSVLGPMIYGAAYWLKPQSKQEEKAVSVFADSKQLTEERRVHLWKHNIMGQEEQQSDDNNNMIGFAVRVLTAAEISRNMMQQPEPYNLNDMSHDAAIQIIQQLLHAGIPLEHCYIDTVGHPGHYHRKLQQHFASSHPGLTFTVEPKADDKYPPCQAASVVAKVTRDFIIQHHSTQFEHSLGSGYPSDPTCKAWIKQQLEPQQQQYKQPQCPVFGFSPLATPLVRFSWNPIKLALAATQTKRENNKYDGGTILRHVAFAADEEEQDENKDHNKNNKQLIKRQRESMQVFLGQQPLSSSSSATVVSKKRRRYPYFVKKRLQTVSDFY